MPPRRLLNLTGSLPRRNSTADGPGAATVSVQPVQPTAVLSADKDSDANDSDKKETDGCPG